jgi:hypothetical protein
MITTALCAVLCAFSVLWVFKPIRMHKHFYAVVIACAFSTLGLYLSLGRPDLPAASVQTSKGAEADYRQMMLDEFTMLDRLSKNENDADAMIRLAVLRLAQGRTGDETERLLSKAEGLTPNDPRLSKIRNLLRD